MSTEIGTITISLNENAAATFKLLLEAVKLTRPAEPAEKCDEVVAEYTGPSEEPHEVPTPVVEEPEKDARRNYTLLEVGRAGAWLSSHKMITPQESVALLGGKAIKDLNQEELNSLAAAFIAKGAVI